VDDCSHVFECQVTDYNGASWEVLRIPGRKKWEAPMAMEMLKTVHFQDVGITPFEKERRKFVYDFFF